MSDDRRALLEAIAFGDDARVSPGDRLRALEQLGELDRVEGVHAAVEDLTPEQLERELEAFGMPAATAVHGGPDAVIPPEQVEADRDAELIIKAQAELIERLEARNAELEAALARWTDGRALPPGPVS